MNIDSIQNGIVLDHISAGMCMEIYRLLRLDQLSCSVAIIKNAKSKRMGRKDIIKIDEDIDVDLNILGYIDPNITVNIIRDGKLVCKHKLDLPHELNGVIMCRNPRCITSTENSAEHCFYLADAAHKIYRCRYCDTAYGK
ncbi:MAG: aspartate carbamoyltransferase regulatory subunit [Clostridiales bacterium]|nr:aspartate carbamoyltransferase regulatory subunit [Clostridiales bacterium]